MSMEAVLTAISSLILILVVVLLAKSRRPAGVDELVRMESELASLKNEFGNAQQQGVAALSELVTRSGLDMRQEVADRIGRGMMEINDRLDARIGVLEKKTSESLEAIRDKVDSRLMEIGKQVQSKLDENLKEGFAHFEKVQEHLKKAEAQLAGVSAVGNSINELNSLLKLPHLRGGFGEAALELLIADFLPPSLYELQAPVVPGSAERVDVLVKLPGASLPIDSKFPREQVLPLFESSDAASLADARKALARTMKEQAKDIAAKYIRPEHGTTDMALMFLPSETLYFEVVRDGELWGFLARHKVYPVSPNTLAVTLKGITLSYEYYKMAKSVEKTIEDIKKAQKHFGHFTERFEHVGKQLERAREAYGLANTHLERYTGSVTRLTGDTPPQAAGPENPGELT